MKPSLSERMRSQSAGMIAERIIAASTLVFACLALSTGFTSAGDEWVGYNWTSYENKVRDAKACIRRQARAYAAGAQEPEQAARLAFGMCEHLFKEGNAAYAKAAGLSHKEADSMMTAGRLLVIRELVEVITNIRQGRPVGQSSSDPDAK